MVNDPNVEPDELKAIQARTYAFFGVGSKDHAETRRALELLEQAKLLISQNHDPEISEQTISGEMASALILLGERERSIELLKKNNAGGIYSDSLFQSQPKPRVLNRFPQWKW